MTEAWRPIPGVPGYSVSDEGRVRGPRRTLKGSIDDGYVKVVLCPGLGVRLHRRVHSLVLEAFVGPCPDGMMCRHRDGVRTNNNLSNLVWGTQEENEADRAVHGTDNSAERNGRSVLDWSIVRQIRSEYRPGFRGKGYKALAKKYNVAPGTVHSVLSGETWKESA